MAHVLPPLPFEKNALSPVMSSETLDFHHGKHHKAYVDKLNQLIIKTEFENLDLESTIKKSSGPIFNNAAQIWNHTFFWNSLSPQKKEPSAELKQKLEKHFSSIDLFKEEFQKASVAQFGSGWSWLVLKPDKSLSIITTSNAGCALTTTDIPLFVCDVWEHAYYIDYRNDRLKFVSQIWNLVNWQFISDNLAHHS